MTTAPAAPTEPARQVDPAPSVAIDTIVGDEVRRFDGAERMLHWTVAVLVLAMLITGSMLYIGPLSTLVPRRLVKDVHVWSGLALPLPWLLTLPWTWGRGLRRDLARLGRWFADDTTWLRSRGQSSTLRLRKFNAGQKLFSIVTGAALPVMLGTGAIMLWFEPFPDALRTGATFVHDWTYLVLTLLVVGHIGKALSEREAMRSMITGRVPVEWARQHRPRWWSEVEAGDKRSAVELGEGPGGALR